MFVHFLSLQVIGPDLVSTIIALGTPVFANALFAWLIVNWAWYAGLDVQKQTLFKAGIALLLTVVSYGLIQLVPASIFAQFQPFWALFYSMMSGVFSQATILYLSEKRTQGQTNFKLHEFGQLIELGITPSAALIKEMFPGHGDQFRAALTTARRREFPTRPAESPFAAATAGFRSGVGGRADLPTIIPPKDAEG